MQQINWEIASTGSHIVRDVCNYDQVLCTAYRNKLGVWRVVVNVDSPQLGMRPHFDSDEFADLESAKKHAEELIAIRDQLEPTPSIRNENAITTWHVQKTKTNGKPTYGRTVGIKKMSVKCSKYGTWYYFVHGSEFGTSKTEWFKTAEDAMAAADRRYR